MEQGDGESEMELIRNCPTADEERNSSTANGDLDVEGSILTHHAKRSSLVLVAGVMWRALTNINTHREVLRLFSLPPFTETVRNNPRFAFKYLTEHYLVRGFSVTQRASCFLHHYRRLYAVLPDRLLRQILHWDVTLHQFYSGNRFALTMGLSRPTDKEGELSLNLKVDDNIVFMLSFTIVPGSVVRSTFAETLLITRLQGTPGCYPEIRLATKAMHDVGPAAVLVAALQGIAMALGIGEVSGVCAKDQSSYCEEIAAPLRSSYDDFFAQLGIAKNSSGFFLGTVPIQEKPLASIKRGHKIRTKEKRAFKQQVQLACASFFLELADRVHDPSVVEAAQVE